MEKNRSDQIPDPQWVEQEIVRLEAAVDEFAAAMKARLAAKARNGWQGWDNPDNALEVWTTMLSCGAASRLAAGHEIDIANLAMMLLRFNSQRVSG